MYKTKRIAFTSAILLLCAGMFSGCSGSAEEQTDPNAPLEIDNITSGIYVMSTDGKFYSPNTDGQNFSGEVTSADAGRIICSKEDSKYIPTIYADDRLVFFTTDEIPETMGVEKFADAGYTYGLYGLYQGNNGSYSFTDDNFIEGSSLKESFNGFLGDSGVANVVSLNGKELKTSDFTEAGTIKCGKMDEKKKLAFMKGTFYNEVDVYADEHVWYSDMTASIPDYEMTKNGFVILTLPASIGDGDYFSVMNTGLICKSDKNRPKEG